MLLLPATPIATMPARSAALLHALLSLVPAMAQGADWSFDSVYGAASVLALPGGQASLVRDGAGQQARSLSYTPGDGTTPVSIVRAYDPHDRKTIESESGTTRHHLYGPGLAPILRMDSDGGFIYQVGLDTIVVDAAGAATLALRVADLKSSTVAVLGAPGQQPGQRVSYASFGSMRVEKTGTDPFTEAVLESAYEGLAVRLLGSDQLVDNRARQYAPASGRFLALDRAGQATAYEARGNNPVSRVDPDGNADFDQLIAAIEQDRSIGVAFGDIHTSISGPQALLFFVQRLSEKNIPFCIFQESNLLTNGPAANKILNDRFQDNESIRNYLGFLLDRGLIKDLDRGVRKITGALADSFRAGYKSRNNLKPDYGLYLSGFDDWKTTISAAIFLMKIKNEVAIFFLGAGHLPRFEHTRHMRHPVLYNNYYSISEVADNKVGLLPLSSFGIQAKFNLASVVPNDQAHWFQKSPDVLSTNEFLLSNTSILPPAYEVNIPQQVFMSHKALADQYLYARLSWVMKKSAPNSRPATGNGGDEKQEEKEEEKKEEEDEEKGGEANAAQRNRLSVLPMAKPTGMFSSLPE